MKKTLLVLLLAVSQSLSAQPEFGVVAIPQTTWLLNNNVSDQGENLNYQTSFGFAGGIRGAFFITDKIGVAAELDLSWFNQRYQGEIDSTHYDGGDHLRYLSIPVFFELKTPGGFYFELGPQFNFLRSATGDLTFDGGALPGYSDRDVKTGFTKSLIGGAFGFGGRFNIADNLVMLAGLRFYGAFTDATEELTEAEFEEAFDNDQLGVAVTFAQLDQDGDFHYEKTMAVSGGLVIGLVYVVGGGEKK